jgi:hypothetical protein
LKSARSGRKPSIAARQRSRAFDNFDLVIEQVGIGQSELGAHAAEAQIASAKDEPADAGMD